MGEEKTNLRKLPRTREEAVSQGETFYFTGVPCKNGHIDKRYTTSSACYTCQREKYRALRSDYLSAKRKRADAAERGDL